MLGAPILGVLINGLRINLRIFLSTGNLQADMSRQGVTTTQKGCCNACDKPIVGQVITALGKTWHPEHFTCNHCSQELGTRNFFERDGHPYCEPDYHNLFSPRCAYCNGAILDVRPAIHWPTPALLIDTYICFLFPFIEMCHRTREDVAYGAFLLCPVWPAVRRGRLPWAWRQAILPQRLLWYVCAQVQRL